MSGNGPLRQLVRLETSAQRFNPDVYLMMFSVGDFLTGELLDASNYPAYKISDDGKVVRSYEFQNRVAVRYVNTEIAQSFLFIIRNIETIRMLWFKEPNFQLKFKINAENSKQKILKPSMQMLTFRS